MRVSFSKFLESLLEIPFWQWALLIAVLLTLGLTLDDLDAIRF